MNYGNIKNFDVANGAGVRKVHDELKLAGIRDLTLKLYEGGRHDKRIAMMEE